MINIFNLSLQFGKRILFDKINIKFSAGNCYGIIGANGAGKSTLLKIISGEIEANTGDIIIENNKRISTLKQEIDLFDKYTVINTVIMGNNKLFKLKEKIDKIYKKDSFSEEDGIKAAELGILYEEMAGWNAESDAASLLSNIGISEKYHNIKMINIENKYKFKILLAQSIFGNPDILILDEPTNHLDIKTISWLEDFLANYKNTVIVVSHDRHFLDVICTHICDIDFGKINIFPGNYSFWYESNQLFYKQKLQYNKKIEEKRKELQNFIQRFSSNASKAKQATSRKKILEKLNVDDIKPSLRKYPSIIFNIERKCGNQILKVDNISILCDNNFLFKNISFTLNPKDKVLFLSKNEKYISILYQILMNDLQSNTGNYTWGSTTKKSYLPINNSIFFTKNITIIDWLKQFIENKEESHEEYIRSFLGRMLFSGEDVFKKVNILSGGEKMRCMISKMMIEKANVLLFHEPTNHLDLECITSLNHAMKNFEGNICLSSKDHELTQTVCNRIIEITPNGIIDKYMTYDEYISNNKINDLRKKYYKY